MIKTLMKIIKEVITRGVTNKKMFLLVEEYAQVTKHIQRHFSS
jgi:hypothetical protein